MKTITIELQTEDAEPILREAAKDAARWGSLADNITRNTYDYPRGHSERFDDARERYRTKFIKAKRVVEAFGVEVDQPSEGETMTVYEPDIVTKSHLVKVAGVTFRHIDASKPNPKGRMPSYRRGVHEEACRQAAERVVKRWRTLADS